MYDICKNVYETNSDLRSLLGEKFLLKKVTFSKVKS